MDASPDSHFAQLGGRVVEVLQIFVFGSNINEIGTLFLPGRAALTNNTKEGNETLPRQAFAFSLWPEWPIVLFRGQARDCGA